jgi:hypothetical protein
MSLSKARQVWTGQTSELELEIAQLRAQVRALSDLLVECGVLDASMVNGRLLSAASRVAPRPLGRPPAPPTRPKKPGFWSRLFRSEKTPPAAPPPQRGKSGRVADATVPEVNLPFAAQVLYGETDMHTLEKRRNLTPTEVGKCQRCWRMRPLASNHLCSRCASQ